MWGSPSSKICVVPVLSNTSIESSAECPRIFPWLSWLIRPWTSNANLRASQAWALVSWSSIFDSGMPPTLPFFRVTGDVKFCGVAISSPKTRKAGWVSVPVFVSVLNKTVFSPPSPSRLIKSSILPSWISISCGPFGLIRYTGPSPNPIVVNIISVENLSLGASVAPPPREPPPLPPPPLLWTRMLSAIYVCWVATVKL